MDLVFQRPVLAQEIKEKARELGADLVGIADGRVMDEHPPDPVHPQRPIDLSELDSGRVIVLAKRVFTGTSRILGWDDRHKFYNDELALTRLEHASLEIVYWLEDLGYPAIIIPPSHTDPWAYAGNPGQHRDTLLSLNHAAVEAGLGTLGLNLQLLTPEFGPRVILTAVMCSVDVEADSPMEEALCLGPSCGRCLKTCPGNVVGHWDRNWDGCDEYRFPYGFNKLTGHLAEIIEEDDPEEQKNKILSKDTFYLWQSTLRGAGAINGCRNCQDDCPIGTDYEARLKDVREEMEHDSAEKQDALAEMTRLEVAGDLPESFNRQRRWIGRPSYLNKE